MRIMIKPLSVNQAHRTYKGRILKSEAYLAYEKELWYLMPRQNVPQGKLELSVKFGISNKSSDLDNLQKPLQDILAKKYLFNDKMIFKLILEKEEMEKGLEYIQFNFKSYEPTKGLDN